MHSFPCYRAHDFLSLLSSQMDFVCLVLVIFSYITSYPKTQWLQTRINSYYLTRFLWVRNSGVPLLDSSSSWSVMRLQLRCWLKVESTEN